MLLYHGTWDDAAEIIKEDGWIKDCYASEATILIDEFMSGLTGRKQRTPCVFLTDDWDSTEAYDQAFIVDTKAIDISKLYVADFEAADQIYCYLMAGDFNTKKLMTLANSYIQSMMPFSQYLRHKPAYRTEFLYFGDIKVDSELNP